VIVLMGSGAETVHETVDWLIHRGERVGVVKVRLFRPFSVPDLLAALPPAVRTLAVLDRTKEPGAVADPLHLEVLAALAEAGAQGTLPGAEPPRVIGGRYGLASKEFDPAMIKAVFDEMAADRPRNHFTLGIVDDVTHTSLPFDRELDVEPDSVVRAVFFGLGADGTVGANKNSIKMIGESTDHHAQGYFVYDSKKAGAVTISHLRFGPRPIRSAYLIKQAGFVACHQFELLDRYDVVGSAAPGATLLLNAPCPPGEVWDRLPREVQEGILAKRLRVFAIDANRVAEAAGMGRHINTVMQTCFFAITGVLPAEEAIARIKDAIRKTYAGKSAEIVARNFRAVDAALEHLHEVALPDAATATRRRPSLVPAAPGAAPELVQRVTAALLAGHGDLLPVSAFPVDGTWPVGTARWEKRNLAQQIPIWDPAVCIQCNQCAFVCPHAAIRTKVYDPAELAGAPESFLAVDYRAADFAGMKYTVQVAPEDCTGCDLCVTICPAKDRSNPRHKAIDMAPQRPVRERERANFDFFLGLPEVDPARIRRLDAKGSQLLQPLIEFSGACAGCGETPYLKLLTQLFGDRLLIANATGCSSIYGGNLPTTPYTTNRDGRGPAWSNSLFEDNAEFGLGFRLAVDQHEAQARGLVQTLSGDLGDALVAGLLAADQAGHAEIEAQRERVRELRSRLAGIARPEARRLESLADYLVRKSVWLVGGDGWAYDIGFGGLDHVLALGRDVNALVLDTEVYSNTGGQQSKATPLGAAAKFAVAGKETAKKDLGLLAMSYGHVYVARIAFGGKINQTVQALLEAEAYPGPSLVIAYSHCIAHGYDLSQGVRQQELAVQSGVWPLYRFDPRRIAQGEPPLQLDSAPPSIRASEYMKNEDRFRRVEKLDPERFRRLTAAAEHEAAQRYLVYQQLAGLHVPAAS
jgi:pyruvate-ferredoxin/flavodoxin oxidoreductase